MLGGHLGRAGGASPPLTARPACGRGGLVGPRGRGRPRAPLVPNGPRRPLVPQRPEAAEQAPRPPSPGHGTGATGPSRGRFPVPVRAFVRCGCVSFPVGPAAPSQTGGVGGWRREGRQLCPTFPGGCLGEASPCPILRPPSPPQGRGWGPLSRPRL